ncbi:MAG: Crp/Fnr family transcriptional regulator [Desulfobulbaceae bacterium A2]|nr:MAG: Crp/Fnr family transcriptional regulator [Desulfobulbaceae bacterium A2]
MRQGSSSGGATNDEFLSENEEKTRDLILTLPFFDVMLGQELDLLARHMNHVALRRGEHLFLEGDPGDSMYFVVSGLFDVMKKTASGDYRTVARIGRGGTIGEMTLLDKAQRSATVMARQPAVVLLLSRKGFNVLTDRYPAIGIKLLKRIMRMLSLQMRRTTSRLADHLHEEQE